MTKNNTAVITSSWKNISICFFYSFAVGQWKWEMKGCILASNPHSVGILASCSVWSMEFNSKVDLFFLLEILTQSWATFTGIVKSIKFDECLTLVKYWCAYWKERIALIWVAFNSKTLAWKSLKKWAILRNCIGRNLVLENGGTLALINRNIKQLFFRFFFAFLARTGQRHQINLVYASWWTADDRPSLTRETGDLRRRKVR